MVNEKNIKFVYKMISHYFEEGTQTFISVADLWKYVQSKGKRNEKGYVTSKNKLKKALHELEGKGKIMFSEDDYIYPM